MKSRILIPEREIAVRVQTLGEEITRYYKEHGSRLDHVLVVLKGATLFAADLLRWLPADIKVDFISASSYRGGTESSGKVTVGSHPLLFSNKNILVVEDIVDTGNTITAITTAFHRATSNDFKPGSIRVATLLDKPSRRQVEVKPDFVGFTIDDLFVFGYGMDLAERYRGVPSIMVMEKR